MHTSDNSLNIHNDSTTLYIFSKLWHVFYWNGRFINTTSTSYLHIFQPGGEFSAGASHKPTLINGRYLDQKKTALTHVHRTTGLNASAKPLAKTLWLGTPGEAKVRQVGIQLSKMYCYEIPAIIQCFAINTMAKVNRLVCGTSGC